MQNRKNKVTTRNPNQTKIDFREHLTINQTPFDLYLEQQNFVRPWAIGIVREYGKITIVIYHSQLRRKYIQFTRFYFDNPLAIVSFVKSIINAHISLGYEMRMNGEDIAKLYAELRKVF